MKIAMIAARAVLYFMLLSCTLPAASDAKTGFSRIVAFGTSLSDPGNAFVFLKQMTLPPYDRLDQFLVPDAPYAKGGHTFSNGDTWIEIVGRMLGLAGDTGPAFQSQGVAANYAVGGARAREHGINTLSTQVDAFLNDVAGRAPSDALYVVEMGANDIRDALAAGASSGGVISSAVDSIGLNIERLYAAGARRFLVLNGPDISLTPAVGILDSLNRGARRFASFLTLAFNSGLEAALSNIEMKFPDIEIIRLDVFGLLNMMVLQPERFGLRVTDSACLTPNTPPFECKAPDEYLFWDGIHPTKTANSALAAEALRLLNR